jgi:hypothetical protein
MKDSRDTKIKRFLCSNTNTKLLRKEDKVYFLLLHEDLYPILFQNAKRTFVYKNNFSKKNVSLDQKKKIKTFNRGSFLRFKYLISLFRLNKFFDQKLFHNQFSEREKSEKYFQLKKKKIFLFHLILESFTFLLVCTQEKRTISEKFFVKPKHISISIHKPLDFLENQWQCSSLGFSGRFFSFLHPEILIRILRKKFQDSFFLHVLRKVFHSNLFSYEKHQKDYFLKSIRKILWNIYILEIDNFFVTDCKDYCFYYSKKSKFFGMNYSFSFLQKIFQWRFFLSTENFENTFKSKKLLFSYSLSTSSNCGILYNQNLDTNILTFQDTREEIRNDSFLEQSSTYKYVRANTNWFMFYQKQEPWNFLSKRRILLFLIRRLGYLPNQKTINSTIMCLHAKFCREISSYIFLAYILQFPKKRSFVKINTKLFFLTNFFVMRTVSFLNPLYLLILILSKYNFCSSLGTPKSKVGWVTYDDSEIIHQFNRIRNNVFLFYTGCQNTKALSRIQYILYVSCAKTLACKHKTNFRYISKKFSQKMKIKAYGPTEFSRFLVKKKSKNFRLKFFSNNQKNIRFWNFHLTEMESIFFHLENFYKEYKESNLFSSPPSSF